MPFFGIRWLEKFYFAVCLTFGCKSSPKISDMLLEAVCWILLNNYAIPHLLYDFLVISSPDAIPGVHILRVQKVFSELGIHIVQEKNMDPSIEFVGINLDLAKFQVSLPKEKIDDQAWSSLLFHCCHSSFNPSEAPPWDSRPVSGAGVVHYQLLHRPRSVPTALGPAPLVTILFPITTSFRLPSTSNYLQTQLPQSVLEFFLPIIRIIKLR